MNPPPGYKLDSEDTSYEAELKLYELYRKMPPWEKAKKICELNQTVETLVLTQLKKDYPKADDREIKLRFGSRKYGAKLMKEAFGWESD